MTSKQILENLKISVKNTKAAIDLVKASANKLQPLAGIENLSFDQLEPYDALCDRFIRAVESSIKFFKSYSKYSQGYIDETFRSLCNSMEKVGLISSTDLWFEMRDIRNRIVHEYLPQEITKIYNVIIKQLSSELTFVYDNIVHIENEINQ